MPSINIVTLIFWFCYCFVLNTLFLFIDNCFCQVHKPYYKRVVCKNKRCRAFDICPYTVSENIGKDFEK